MNTIPREFSDAMLLAITPAKHCVGVKLFADARVTDYNGNSDDDYGSFIDRCLHDAIDLKEAIESGKHDVDHDPRIVKSPKNDYINVEKMLELRAKRKLAHTTLKHEKMFVDLGQHLVKHVEIGRFDYVMCSITFGELNRMMQDKVVTCLMLKKNPEIVKWISKLCRFAVKSLSPQEEKTISEQSQRVRTDAKQLLNEMKRLMDFEGPNEVFMEHFAEHVDLFNELTAHLTPIEKCQLTIEPELSVPD